MNLPGTPNAEPVCPRATGPILSGSLDEVLTREWLLTNGTGGYASGTVVGCPTRRYHGLLIAARRPPLERVVCFSTVLERVVVAGDAFELANFEFNHAVHPQGHRWLTDFDYALAPPRPWVQWVYKLNGIQIIKRLTLTQGEPRARLRYEVTAPPDVPVQLNLLPFLALRDFHALRRKAADEPFEVRGNGSAVWLADARDRKMGVALFPTEDSEPVRFDACPDWWYNFRYREEAARGQACGEDLFTPGWFRSAGRGAFTVELLAVVGAETIADARAGLAQRRAVPRHKPPAHRNGHDEPIAALRPAADQFVVRRRLSRGREAATILAGYHWFGDWGRDALIALPGLLLGTGRHADARDVLLTFASAEREGLIPNRFRDYGEGCDYNSVDASLWFIHAADAYLRATDDFETWCNGLGPVCEKIVDTFLAGTRYGIGAGGNRLLRCGDASTQLTWMDAKWGNVVFTPRHGMPVEINALWHHDLCLLAERCAMTDPARAEHYRSLAAVARSNFLPRFWNDAGACLYDCVRDDGADAAIRPNQIFAVSLEHSPLDRDRQRDVLSCVTRHLLTPVGLRSLSPADPAYRGRYEGDGFSRDGAYHQGTVWAWPLGHYIEAYLRVHEFSDAARDHCRRCLKPLTDHLSEAGLGTISEIFDGDPPHTPRGCIAQAWSVAEVLRAAQLVESRAPVCVA